MLNNPEVFFVVVNVECLVHFCVVTFVFFTPAGAQTDPELHEGRLYGENRTKGLSCGVTHWNIVRELLTLNKEGMESFT